MVGELGGVGALEGGLEPKCLGRIDGDAGGGREDEGVEGGGACLLAPNCLGGTDDGEGLGDDNFNGVGGVDACLLPPYGLGCMNAD